MNRKTLAAFTFILFLGFVQCKKHDTFDQDKVLTLSFPEKYEGYGPTYNGLTREAPNDVRMRTFYCFPSYLEWDDRLGFYQGPEIMFCAPPKGNCFPTVIVTSDRNNDFCNAARAFQRYHEHDSISYFFNGDSYKLLFPEMDLMTDVLDSIREGKIELRHFYNEADTVDYYIGVCSNMGHKQLDSLNPKDVRCVLRIRNE